MLLPPFPTEGFVKLMQHFENKKQITNYSSTVIWSVFVSFGKFLEDFLFHIVFRLIEFLNEIADKK